MSLRHRLNLLRRFTKGRTTSAEDRVINDWYYSVDDTRNLSLFSEKGTRGEVRESMRRHIFGEIGREQTRNGRVRVLKKNLFRATAAAAALFVLTMGYFFVRRPAAPAQYAVSAPLGVVQRVLLPDSSIVWLKSGTTIKYGAGYGSGDRRIQLVEGEAFFDVKKDEAHPFLVNAEHMNIQVLGTAFNIQAYKENSSIQVWVDHGAVRVRDSGKLSTVLTADHRLQWDRLTNRYSSDSLRWQQALAWQKGVLVLQSATFTELSAQLKEIYGVRLVTKDASIRGQLYDVKFFMRTPLPAVLQTLSAIHPIHFRRQDGTVWCY